MSAMTGIWLFFAMIGSASASSRLGTATRTMSQPDAVSSAICCRVALMFVVGVVVIDCTLTWASPPTSTLPTLIWRDLRRGASTSGTLGIPRFTAGTVPVYGRAASSRLRADVACGGGLAQSGAAVFVRPSSERRFARSSRDRRKAGSRRSPSGRTASRQASPSAARRSRRTDPNNPTGWSEYRAPPSSSAHDPPTRRPPTSDRTMPNASGPVNWTLNAGRRARGSRLSRHVHPVVDVSRLPDRESVPSVRGARGEMVGPAELLVGRRRSEHRRHRRDGRSGVTEVVELGDDAAVAGDQLQRFGTHHQRRDGGQRVGVRGRRR